MLSLASAENASLLTCVGDAETAVRSSEAASLVCTDICCAASTATSASLFTWPRCHIEMVVVEWGVLSGDPGGHLCVF